LLFHTYFFCEQARRVVEEIDVAFQQILARHLINVIGCDANILECITLLRSNSHVATDCHCQLRSFGQLFFERRFAPEIFSQCRVRSHIGPAAAGRFVNAENRSTVILETRNETFRCCVTERIRDYDHGPIIDATTIIARVRISIGKTCREHRFGSHRALDRWDPRRQSLRPKAGVGLPQLAELQREWCVEEAKRLGRDWRPGGSDQLNKSLRCSYYSSAI